MAQTESSQLLKINYLTEKQYADAKANGEINDDELYMTPESDSYGVRGVILYSNSAGSTGTITLEDDASNYEYIDIYFKQHEYTPIYNSVRVYSPNDKQVDLSARQAEPGGTGIASAYVHIKGNSITKKGSNVYWTNGGNQGKDVIYITRVVGYKTEIPIKPNGEDAYDDRIYSTGETAIGVWINNKPIYRKVITGITATGIYNHGISNFEDLVDIYGCITKSNGGKEPIPRTVLSSANQYGIAIGDINGDRIYVEFGSSYTGVKSGYVVLEYTKTTD